jgi:hypothetical protein
MFGIWSQRNRELQDTWQSSNEKRESGQILSLDKNGSKRMLRLWRCVCGRSWRRREIVIRHRRRRKCSHGAVNVAVDFLSHGLGPSRKCYLAITPISDSCQGINHIIFPES